MEQDLEADVPVDSQLGFPHDLKEALSHLLGPSYSLKPRPPSGCPGDIKRKVARSPKVLPRLLRQAPAGLNASLKGLRDLETDDDDVEASDAGISTSPTVKRTAGSFHVPSTLTPEQQALIFRCKLKPPRPSNADSDISLPTSSGYTAPSSTLTSPTGVTLSKGQETPYSVYSVVRRSSSCRFSDGFPAAGTEVQPAAQLQLSQQAAILLQQQPSTLQRHALIAQRQASMLLQQQQQQQQQPSGQRYTQGSPHPLRQGQALLPSSALMSNSVEWDHRGQDTPHGSSKRGSNASRNVRSALSRSTTPTGRSPVVSQSRRGSHGWVGGPPGGGGIGGGSTPFGTTSGLAVAAALTSAGGNGSANGNVAMAISAPVAISGSPASFILRSCFSSSGTNSATRSPLVSPLSAPPTLNNSVAKPSMGRSTVINVSGIHSSFEAPGSPKNNSNNNNRSLGPVPPSATPPAAQYSSGFTSHTQGATGGSVGALQQHADPCYGGSGLVRSPSRRFGVQAGTGGGRCIGGGGGGVGWGGGGGGLLSGSAGGQPIERGGGEGGNSSPLLRIPSTLGAGHVFMGLPQPATSAWPQSATAAAAAAMGGGGRSSNNGFGHAGGGGGGVDAELTVARRSCSAITIGSNRNWTPDHGSDEPGRASVVLTNVSENDEDSDRGGGGFKEAVATGEQATLAKGGELDGAHDDNTDRQPTNIGELLKAFSEEGPLSAAARQLAALHRAHEKSRARRGLTKGQTADKHSSGSRWRSALTGRG